MDTIQVSTSQNVAIDYPVAGLGERISARLIDLGIFFITYIIFIIVGLVVAFSKMNYVVLTLFILYISSYVFYNLIFEIFMNGQTIGKRIMKIRVISLDGGQASLGQHFIRWLFRLADFLFTAQVGGLVCIAVTENKQRIGDLVAGTTVIKTIPRTKIEHIAFRPGDEDEAYIPIFSSAHQLKDHDIELIHEVLMTYYKTRNYEIVEAMSLRITEHISVVKPNGMNALDFLKTVVKDYNHITSVAI